jgi:uncharacterized protein
MRLLVFARAPVAGQAKTRLIPALGAQGAARLHGRLVRRALEAASASGAGPVELWCTPDCSHAFLQDCARAFDCSLQPQPTGDLGRRMRVALETGLPAVLLGSDAPGLTGATVGAAAAALAQGNDCVLVPALDGGYVLIGLAVPAPRLFEGIGWGGSGVLEQTRRRAGQLGLRLAELPPCPDIDRPEDLVHCPAELLRGLMPAP